MVSTYPTCYNFLIQTDSGGPLTDIRQIDQNYPAICPDCSRSQALVPTLRNWRIGRRAIKSTVARDGVTTNDQQDGIEGVSVLVVCVLAATECGHLVDACGAHLGALRGISQGRLQHGTEPVT